MKSKSTRKETNMADKDMSRRNFIQATAAVGTAIALAGPLRILAKETKKPSILIESRGLAARDATGKLTGWQFQRRGIGEYDVLIDIKFAGICHSDIHQLRGDWGPQKYPQVPGHEIAGVVAAVGNKVTKFKVGDKAGVGCMVSSCGKCDSCEKGEEQYCERGETMWTYGYPDKTSPSGITQGGYSNNIVVKERFAVKIPKNLDLKDAAPLLCAGITTYSPIIKQDIKKGDKVGVAGIGGLGHMAIQLAVSKGAEVVAFTTTKDKIADIRKFGATPVFVSSPADLAAHAKKLDFMISTIPVEFNVAAYAAVLKPDGHFIQVGMAKNFSLTINNLALAASRINYSASLIGGMKLTQEIIDYCAHKGIKPVVQVIKADQVNESWNKVVNKEARYRYVIDASTI